MKDASKAMEFLFFVFAISSVGIPQLRANELGGFVGVTNYDDMDIASSSQSKLDLSYELENAYNLSFYYGRSLPEIPGLAAEIDFSYNLTTTAKKDIQYSRTDREIQTFDVGSYVLTGNILYHPPASQGFMPYLGLGIGFAVDTLDNFSTKKVDAAENLTETKKKIDDKNTFRPASWQLLFGAKMTLNERLYLNGRISYTSYGPVDYTDSSDSGIVKSKDSLTGRSFLLGVGTHI